MERIAQVLVNIPTRRINKLFSYIIPEKFSFLDIGWRVIIPFGSRKVEGFITGIEYGDIEGLKEIAEVWDTDPWFNEHITTVAVWLSEYYLCSLGEALRLFIPGGSTTVSQIVYHFAMEPDEETTWLNKFTEETAEIAAFIRRTGSIKHEALLKKFGAMSVNVVRQLLKVGLIRKEYLAVSKVKAQYRTSYRLALPETEVPSLLSSLKGRPAQRRIIELMSERSLIDDFQISPLKISKPLLVKFINSGVIEAVKTRVMRNSYSENVQPKIKRILSQEQQAAFGSIREAVIAGKFQTFLLHGVTGSGKTEVYMDAAEAARQEKRNVIVLVPEIALTSQIVQRFKARFGTDVTVIHSKLSIGERNDAWEKIRSGEAGIVIGARSALFSPMPNIGLIILDEEHEFTYKQEETPRYHAREVALMRARISQAAVVLGSATPSVETYYKCKSGEYTLLSMPNRVSGELPVVSVVDMREELKQGNRSVISAAMYETIASSLYKGEQAIVLLNRRGYATFILCRECGFVMQCDHCAVSLVYHSTGKTLRCHYCQRSGRVPDQCPSCRSRYIRFFGSGTQKVEEELQKLLPQARILRMDQDTTGKKLSHDRILEEFSSGRFDILLGTQMVAKGHDISNVTAVGIVSADTSLNLPDFRAAEKSFALIMQASGRAGRGEQPGRVVVQTYNPEHYAVIAGSKQDYEMFYNTEIGFRKALGYPPFSRLIKITITGLNESGIRHKAEEMIRALQLKLTLTSGVEIFGPLSAAVSKVDDVFRVNVLIKAEEISYVQQALTDLGYNAQPGIIVDVDPLNVM